MFFSLIANMQPWWIDDDKKLTFFKSTVLAIKKATS
jgi:hypothetical protein